MYKVVIAEDEHLIRRELMMMIDWQTLNLTVVGEAADGQQALDLVMEHKPHLLIADIRMPALDGISLIRQLKGQMDMEFLIISALTEFDCALQAIKLGVADYILKPIDETVMTQTLLKITARLDPADQAATIAGTKLLSPRQAGNLYMQKSLQYLEGNYSTDIAVGMLAEQLHISDGYLSKLFVKYTGMRFSEYLNYYRVSKAVELLSQTGLKIYQIAEMIGYKDYRHFSFVFKSIMGISPNQYKDNCLIFSKNHL